LKEIETNALAKHDFETTLKITSKKKDIFEHLIEYLQLAFDVEPTSQQMYNCETGVYFQFLSLKKREA